MKKLLFVFGMLLLGLTSSLLNAQTGWMQQTNPLGDGDTSMVGNIQFVSSTEGWISAIGGSLLHTTDAGSNWSVVTPFPNDTVWSFSDPDFNMSFINPSTGWIMKSLGSGFDDAHGAVVYKTTDGGSVWEKIIIAQNPGNIGAQIQFVDENNGYASFFNMQTENGYLSKTTDGGTNWSVVNELPATDEAALFYFIDSGTGWMVSINDNPPLFQITQTTDGGANWTVQYSDNTVNGDTSNSSGAMQFTDSNNGWVVGPNGRILKTNNGGTNWELLNNSGIGIYANSKCLFFLDENIGWIGTNINIPNQQTTHLILHTTDGGNSWTQEQIPFSHDAVFSIYFLTPQNGWFTADYGIIAHYNGFTSIENENNIPIEYSLKQNYPNPFNPTTTIKYSIGSNQFVKINVYDLIGNEVASLVNEQKTSGEYKVNFDASNLSSGIYFYQLKAGTFIQTRKMLLLK